MHLAPQAPDQVRSRKELASAGLELGDVDLFERNEAFAAMANKRRPRFDEQVRTGPADGYCY